MIKKKLKKSLLNQKEGAAAVEFAAALIGLLLFFAIFIQFILFFIAHQRLVFTGFVASRTYAVKGFGQAVSAANSVDPQAYPIQINYTGLYTREVDISKKIEIPKAFRPVFSRGQSQYNIKVTTGSFSDRELKYHLDPRSDNFVR